MAGKTMKALVLRKHGDLHELQVVGDYPVPQATEGHVVIRVSASSFNYHDVFTVRGMPGIKVPLPVIIGLDMAGEIAEVGAGVPGWKAGDRVLVNPLNKKKGLMGEMLDGGMAEYCLVAADQLVAMPAGVSFEDAASLPVAYGTAHRMLITHNTVKRGDRVIVLGASGGVGTGCVMLAKLLGAEVIAGVERGEDAPLARARRRRSDRLQQGRLVQMGDREIRQAAAPLLRGRRRRGGEFHRRRHLGAVVALPQARRQAPGVRRDRRPRPEGGPPLHLELRDRDQGFQQLLQRQPRRVDGDVQQGKIKPVIDKVLPLEQAREGLRLIQDREVIGKVVVTP